MTATQKIKMAVAFKGIPEAELARRLGVKPQALNLKMKDERFTIKDMEQIAEALELGFEYAFQLPDGKKI